MFDENSFKNIRACESDEEISGFLKSRHFISTQPLLTHSIFNRNLGKRVFIVIPNQQKRASMPVWMWIERKDGMRKIHLTVDCEASQEFSLAFNDVWHDSRGNFRHSSALQSEQFSNFNQNFSFELAVKVNESEPSWLYWKLIANFFSIH